MVDNVNVANDDESKTIVSSKEEVVIDTKKISSNQLFNAVRRADVHTLKLLLSWGSDVNQRDPNECTSLSIAARMGFVKVCEFLLSKGARVDDVDKRRWSALMHATDSGHERVVELLLRKGADVNRKDTQGSTAMHYAAMRDYCSIIKLLLRNGAKRDSMDSNGFNPITIAAARGRIGAVRLLMNCDSKICERFKTCPKIKRSMLKAATLNKLDQIAPKSKSPKKSAASLAVEALLNRSARARFGVQEATVEKMI